MYMINYITHSIMYIAVISNVFSYIPVSYQYSPTICDPLNYSLTFIYDNGDKVYKIHGLWPEVCSQCNDCGYPSCCDNTVTYVSPNDPTEFIKYHWYQTYTTEDCTHQPNVTLFEHEYYKHATCISSDNYTTYTETMTTTEFLDTVISLYDRYYSTYVYNKCDSNSSSSNASDELWLSLDQNYEYIETICK